MYLPISADPSGRAV